MIARALQKNIEIDMFKGKAILLFGGRQTGKTTLINQLLKNRHPEVLFLNGDEPDVQTLLTNITSTALKNIAGGKKIIFIDEAQRIDNIGITIKLIVDTFPNIQVIASGSSSLELANRSNEPLTGRKFIHHLFPLSFNEMCNEHGVIEEQRNLEHRLIYGYYPEVVITENNPERILRLLADSFLYKDLLMFEEIKKPVLLSKILRALALQIGNEVSYTEIAQLTGSNKNTVEKYIDLLEKVFVIFSLPAFSRNIRNEIKKGRKVYFYDNGIRNAIIGNFNPLPSRTDVGPLWENFIINERKKVLSNNMISTHIYFWRTTQQQEIDYIEERNGTLHAFECKWNRTRPSKCPVTFSKAYSPGTFDTITRENYVGFIGGSEDVITQGNR
jgi:uncharacterized protein